jgi:hypothetical protein
MANFSLCRPGWSSKRGVSPEMRLLRDGVGKLEMLSADNMVPAVSLSVRHGGPAAITPVWEIWKIWNLGFSSALIVRKEILDAR